MSRGGLTAKRREKPAALCFLEPPPVALGGGWLIPLLTVREMLYLGKEGVPFYSVPVSFLISRNFFIDWIP